MNKKPNKSRTGLLIGIGSFFLTITVAGVIVAGQIAKHDSVHNTPENGMNQTLENVSEEDMNKDHLFPDDVTDVDDAAAPETGK